MAALVARRCFISGRVQGVFFRASTRQRANELGVKGHASNLPDGRVEVLVVGESSAVQQLIEWLHRGPPSAHVTQVDVEELALDELDDMPTTFATR
jgi:acylphosphatase